MTLFTNGTQITEAIADTLVEWPPFAIEITLYGRTRETYERLTGVPGSFDRCMRGIRLLKERGLPLALKTVAVTLNRHEISDMQRFATEELGVTFKFDGMINARIDCSHSPLEVRLTPGEMVQLDFEDPVREAEWSRLVRDQTPRPANAPAGDNRVPLRRWHQRVLDRSRRQDEHLRAVEEGHVRPARRHRSAGLEPVLDQGARPPGYACHEVHDVPNPRPLLELRRDGRARGRRRRDPRRLLLRGGAPLAALHVVGFRRTAHGECDFCEGGRRHAELLVELDAVKRGARGVRRRRSLGVVDGEGQGAHASSCGSGGCGSCGSSSTT